MGLAVVHGIVTNLHGTITVDTKEGKGTTFRVILPVVENEEKQETKKESPIPVGNERILLVDDEAEIIKMGAEMLANLGYQPVVANDAEEAFRIFELNPSGFDVVITDQVMPGMSGIELCKKIHTLNPSLPVILCTGFSKSMTAHDAENAGVCELIIKPIGMRQLAEAIRRALEPSGGTAISTKEPLPIENSAPVNQSL